ncbi:non-canonical purine NTP pyrophosphatase, RdgB/HAM1 family [Nitrosopumilus cobalaminigenes]|uniref:Non-canonical purine NTP pyrophosphatase, RdgB/HAM1 family n=1 Tax=Nitrosopumilus cobalaminigenes TaxID=1470066 RepID=A0A7D5M4F5_9ARCH|nr:RdgB/HAM1 family non-canonical purine NTP pyrophosphatase [Nitrosopumilus cobalaminigenes]QLH03489.1 non-canonical purine NTP pyrophosphatase, RdgB/HAM1 family [Nitrosopumilus cobalaminigenes]
MHKSFDLFFVSSNNHKYQEAKKILDSFGINLGFLKSDLEEIQSNSLHDIAIVKARDAFSKFKKPIIIEDDGLFVDSLDGFPGPYSSYVFKTIGNKGIINLIKNNRKAKFLSIVTYCDKTLLESFDGKQNGTISKTQRGKGWGYDPIFIPNNFKKTFAELNNKNELSHRYKALKKFSKWYLNK